MKGARKRAVPVTVRPVPWPYRAMLAICSDLDETPDAQVYFAISRFLNTTDQTAMGRGVGLEVGNTIFFDMAPGQFSYWGASEDDRERVRTLIRSGHIDAIHSWGDLATERQHAEHNLAELQKHDCRLEVWIDHSKAPSNFGPDIMQGSGDLPSSRSYHADLTLAYGVRYVWRGRTTGLTAQDAPIRPQSFAPILRSSRPGTSAYAALKEAVKIGLGGLGRPRWAMYAANRVCRPSTLRDGRKVWEFLRTNPSWGGPGESATAAGVEDVLTKRMLDRLIGSEGVAIVYTHLGKVRDAQRPFGPGTEAAFRALARLHHEKKVFVTTTRRLLGYRTLRDALSWRAAYEGDRIVITLESVNDPVTGPRAVAASELDGLTFGVPGRRPAELRLADGTPLPADVFPGEGGTSWLSIRWRPLRFPL
jgi:hypothetical protein